MRKPNKYEMLVFGAVLLVAVGAVYLYILIGRSFIEGFVGGP